MSNYTYDNARNRAIQCLCYHADCYEEDTPEYIADMQLIRDIEALPKLASKIRDGTIPEGYNVCSELATEVYNMSDRLVATFRTPYDAMEYRNMIGGAALNWKINVLRPTLSAPTNRDKCLAEAAAWEARAKKGGHPGKGFCMEQVEGWRSKAEEPKETK